MAAQWVRQRFVAEVVPACLALGLHNAHARHLTAVGAMLSDWGRVTPGHNYWGAEAGDMDSIWLVSPRYTNDIATGGLSPKIELLGWFSSVSLAIQDAISRGALNVEVPTAELAEVIRLGGKEFLC